MLGNRGFPEAWSRLCVCQASFLMTFAIGGVPHAGPQQLPRSGKWLSIASTNFYWSKVPEPTQIQEDPISQWEKWPKAFVAIFNHKQWIELVLFLHVNPGELRLACCNETGGVGDDTRRPGNDIKETSSLINSVCLLDVSSPPAMLLDLQMLMLIYWRSG